MSIQEIRNALRKSFQGVLKNIVSLANDSTLEDNYKVLKIGEEPTTIELSKTDVKIHKLDTNTLTVKGDNALTGIIDGQLIGYTHLNPEATSVVSHTLQTSFTVEDSTHQISFTVPPSGNVEIEASFFINRTSTSDVTIFASLSDNSTYNKLDEKYEYDYSGYVSDDEADDAILIFKWTVDSLIPNTATTYYIGLKSSDASAAYLIYGVRTSHNLTYPPFIIKATALPTTIYTG